MTALAWDKITQRIYEAGVNKGVLFPTDDAGEYTSGVAWNGLTTVTESPSGAESNKQYADNIVYVNLLSAEEFGGTIEAFMSPPEFDECDGAAELAPGVMVTQQRRRVFGMSYESLIGNDTQGVDFGRKIHLLYGCQAAPSEKAYGTINESPEAMALSWEITTTPVAVTGLKPTALVVINTTKVDPDALAAFEEILYGNEAEDPRLPLPDEVADLLGGDPITVVDLGVPANQPTYNAGTHIVTLPAVAGVQWKVNGVNKAPGAQPALAVGQTAEVKAVAQPGNRVDGSNDWTFDF